MSFWSSLGSFAKDNAADLIGAGVQLYGANRASSAANKAAKQQQAALVQAQQQQAPYAGLGKQAANRLSGMSHGGRGGLLRNFSGSDFQADPGYQFRQQEGINAIEKSAAARGKRLSGGALKAISDYGQDTASNEYGRAYDRFNQNKNQNYNMLAGQINAGMGASGTIGNYMAQGGDAASAATISGSNAWNNALGNAIQPWQMRSMMRV